MDLDPDSMHVAAAYAAVALGVLGPVLGILYAVLVDRRDLWRKPMLGGATLTLAAVLGAYLSGRRLVEAHPSLADDPIVAPHLEYADRLLLPGVGFFVVAVLTGLLNPRTGALRTVLPLLLTGFSVVVLVLVVLSSDSGARVLLDQILELF
ncbi:hypothetical protein [Nocardioides sp. GXQ0305]|uniref:hypothetical protein n=1 Tax=Nocardioides sp. GXQ0305 TaxID=3423912 RepID=UPI003D7CD6B9